MLIHKQTKQVFNPQPKKYSESFLRQYYEIKEPQTHRGHPFFKLEQRVHMKQ